MKILALNINGGKIFEESMEFIKKQSADTDIFCFQEVFDNQNVTTNEGYRMNLLNEIKAILPSYNYIFSSAIDGYLHNDKVDFELSYGIVIFYKNNINILKSGEGFVHLDKNNVEIGENFIEFPRNFQYIQFLHNDFKHTVINFHGLHDAECTKYGINHKADDPHRIAQSNRLREYMDEFAKDSRIILIGDFNLMPETESINIIEKDLVNLIKKHNITSTRNKNFQYFATSPHYADYAILSPDIEVKDFQVLPDEVSDHASLQLVI